MTVAPVLSRVKIADLVVQRLGRERMRAAAEFRQSGRVASFILEDGAARGARPRHLRGFPAGRPPGIEAHIGAVEVCGIPLTRTIRCLPRSSTLFRIPASCARSATSPVSPDNSNDIERNNYRVLNLLYYITPDWQDDAGGHLELWDNGPGKPQRTIHSRFNRLVVMQTDERSWHSVSKVVREGRRCCVSNYYFSPRPAGRDASYHVTAFRGWPGQKLADVVMRIDNGVRLAVRKIGGNQLFKNPHVYKK